MMNDPRIKALADTNPKVKQQLMEYDSFRLEFVRLKEQYEASGSPEDLAAGIRRMSGNPIYHKFHHFLIFLGDSYMKGGDPEAGAACLKAVAEHFPFIHHNYVYYLRMAQYHIEKGETETGAAYLIRLCTEVTDYEVRLAMFDLTEVWEKYRPLVAERAPELLVKKEPQPVPPAPGPQPKQPGECSQPIGEILALPESDLLAELSAHLGEMTANGAYLNCLNKWERVFYYADEVCMEVNSGGFEGYLYYHGAHFPKACQAFAQIGAEQMGNLMNQVQSKFPRSRVPKTEEAIQNAMDRLEEKGVDFEAEDDIYYTAAEKELLSRLAVFVRENRKHFR